MAGIKSSNVKFNYIKFSDSPSSEFLYYFNDFSSGNHTTNSGEGDDITIVNDGGFSSGYLSIFNVGGDYGNAMRADTGGNGTFALNFPSIANRDFNFSMNVWVNPSWDNTNFPSMFNLYDPVSESEVVIRYGQYATWAGIVVVDDNGTEIIRDNDITDKVYRSEWLKFEVDYTDGFIDVSIYRGANFENKITLGSASGQLNLSDQTIIYLAQLRQLASDNRWGGYMDNIKLVLK